MRIKETKEGAGNEVGTSMERTMYPDSGLSVEIRPLVLPECLMYGWITMLLVELCWEEEEGSSRLVSTSLYVGW